MQIPSRFLTAFAAAVLLSPLRFYAQDSDVEARERDALRQKMDELRNASAAKPTPPPAIAPQAPAPPTVVIVPPPPEASGMNQPESKEVQQARQALHEKMVQSNEFSEVPVTQSSGDVEKERAAVRQKLATENALARGNAEFETASAPGREGAKQPGAPSASSLSDLPAPPPAVSDDKQRKLQDLLDLYRTDQISPREYQARRAAILAQH